VTLITLAWRNLWRHARRSVLTALAVALGVAMCVAVLSLYDGMFGLLREVVVDRQVGHVQILHEGYRKKRGMFDTLQHAEAGLAAVDRLAEVRGAVPRLSGQTLLGGPDRTAGAELIGVDPVRERRVTRLDTSIPTRTLKGKEPGRFLSDDARREILMGLDLAVELHVAVGDEVVAVTQDAQGGIGNELYTVVGLVETGDPGIDKAGAFVHLNDLQALLALPDQVHELRVIGPSDERDAVNALSERLASEVLPHLATPDGAPMVRATWWELNPIAAQMFELQSVSSGIILFVVFSLATVGVVNTMWMSVLERTREFGVMMALGLRPAQVVGMVVIEATLLGVLAAGAGTLLGLALALYLSTVGIDFSVSEDEGFNAGGFALPSRIYGAITLTSVVQPVVGAIVLSVLAAVWPAARAASLRPVRAIRGV
jgi:ABC-type lipoprotein release transport system permease subunit